MKFFVECVEIGNGYMGQEDNPRYGIQSIGGKYEGASENEVLTTEQAIARINAGERFVTRTENAPEAEIEVINGEYGPYLRTTADDSEEDNLLHLGSCADIQGAIDLKAIRSRTILRR